MSKADRVLMGTAAVLAVTATLLAFHGRPAVRAESELTRALAASGDVEGGTWRVAILFQLQDCEERLEAIRAWEALLEDPRISVTGLVMGGDAGAFADRTDRLGIRLPLRAYRPSGRLIRSLRALGYRTTPLVVVVDDAGRVRILASLDRLSTEDDARTFVESALRI